MEAELRIYSSHDTLYVKELAAARKTMYKRSTFLFNIFFVRQAYDVRDRVRINSKHKMEGKLCQRLDGYIFNKDEFSWD